MGEKCEAAADQERRRNRDKDPPGRREQMPQEFRRHEQFDQPARDRDRPGQDEFRQAARQSPPGKQREHDDALADHAPGDRRR